MPDLINTLMGKKSIENNFNSSYAKVEIMRTAFIVCLKVSVQ